MLDKLRKRFSFSSIRQRLLIIFSLALIPLTVVGIYFTLSIRQDIIDSKERDTQVEMQRMGLDIKNILDTVVYISNQIYQAPQLDTMVSTNYESLAQLIEAYDNFYLFDQVLRYYGAVDSIRFLTDNESMLTNTNFLYATDEVRQTEWYQQALENYGRMQWQVMSDPVTGKEVFSLVRMVRNSENKFLGVLCLFVDQSLIRNIVSGSAIDSFLTLDDSDTILVQKSSIDTSLLNQAQATKFPEMKKGDSKELSMNNGDVLYLKSPLDISLSNLNNIYLNVLINQKHLLSDVNNIMFQSYSLIVVVLIIVFVMIIVFTNHFNARFITLKRSMKAVSKGDFAISPTISGKDEITEIYATLYQTMESLQQLLVERYEHSLQEKNWQILQKQSEFALLSSQINPHFLYNTLEMIRMKAVINKDLEVADSIKLLSRLLRRSLETNTAKTITLEKELDLIRLYMSIQQIRFSDRLQYRLISTVDEKAYIVLPLIIQPIVENAFAHGVENRLNDALVAIHIFEWEERLIIRVIDNGMGMNANTLAEVKRDMKEPPVGGEHIGLYNVDQRIKSFYGQEYGLFIDSIIGEGTIVDLVIKKELV